MINMLLTILLMLLMLFVFSCRSKNEKECVFGSFYHTGIVRGFATFIIVVSHIGGKSGYRFFTPLGGIGVSLFIICSGFGLYKSYCKNGLNNYFKKRFTGLLIPYWIVYTCFAIYNHNSFTQLIKGILLIEVPGMFWYVQYIALMYILFYITFKLFDANKAIITFLIISILLFIINKELLLGEQSFAFFFGLFIGKTNIGKTKENIGLMGLFGVGIGVISLIFRQTAFIRDANYLVINFNGVLLKTITALGIILIIYSLLEIRTLNIFNIADKYSYEIYLVHMALGGILVVNFTILNVIIFLGVSIVMSVILNNITKQIIMRTIRIG